MRLRSTRDAAAQPREFTFEEAVLSGLAPDGGMMLPVSVPQVPPDVLKKWCASERKAKPPARCAWST